MVKVLDAGHRERQALLAWWKKNVTDHSFMWQLEQTDYDPRSDAFKIPQTGRIISVTACIQLGE
jgi:hypothetical protein